MNKRHKHYDVIVAWAEGKEIQFRAKPSDVWNDFKTWDAAPTFHSELQYRIKPEPKPDLVREGFMTNLHMIWNPATDPNLRLTFSGEDGRLIKAEMI